MCSQDRCKGKGKGLHARKIVSACALFLLGSVCAWAGAVSTGSGEIVLNRVGSTGKTFTMRGEMLGNAAKGFDFAVPGKKFDVKCTLYPYGYPQNPYNNISSLEIDSAQTKFSYPVGKIETYRFVLKCPMAGPFISKIREINQKERR